MFGHSRTVLDAQPDTNSNEIPHLDLELGELLQGALVVLLRRLSIGQLLLLGLLDSLADLLETILGQELLLLLDGEISLLQLGGDLLDLSIDIADVTANLEKDGDLGVDDIDGAASWQLLIGAQDADLLDTLAAERPDSGDLSVDSGEAALGSGLDERATIRLDVVVGSQGADAAGALETKLVVLSFGSELKLGFECGVRSKHDGLAIALLARKTLPELLGDVGHDGVEKAQRHVNGVVEGLLDALLLLGSTVAEDTLAVLDKDVAELIVEELVGDLGGSGELAGLKSLVHALDGNVHAVKDPLLRDRQVGNVKLSLGSKLLRKLAKDVLGGLPDLVAESAVSVHNLDIKVDITTASGVGEKGETHGVSAALRDTAGEGSLLVLGSSGDFLLLQVTDQQLGVEVLELNTTNDIKRVDDVAQRLGHLPTLGITDQTVAVHLCERHLSGHLETEHDHTGNPEEKNIPAGLEHAGREELLEVEVLSVGPAKNGHGPKSGAEPGIETVRILLKGELAAGELGLSLGLSLLLCPANNPLGLFMLALALLTLKDDAVGRNTMAPPELTRNAPILDIGKPPLVGLVGALGGDLDLALLDDLERGLAHLLHADPPLLGHHGLDDVLGLLAKGNLHGVGLLLDEESKLGQLLHNSVTGIEAFLTLEGAGVVVQGSVLVENVDELKVVTLAELVIVEIVGRGQLDSTGTELLVDVGVGDNREETVDEGVAGELANKVGVARILGVDGNTGITKHGLGTGGGNLDSLLGTVNLVLEVSKDTELDLLVVTGDIKKGTAGNLFVLHLQTTESGVQVGAPVHQAVGPVDEALVVKAAESLHRGSSEVLVHGEGLTLPVHRATHELLGVVDALMVVALPFPDQLGELLTAKFLTDLLLLLPEHLLDDGLGRNTGMITTGHPQGLVALHAVPADQSILEGVGESMAAVESAGDVRRWQRDDELASRGFPAGFGLKVASLLPPLIPGSLDGAGVVCREMGMFERLDDLLLAGGGFVFVGRESRGLLLLLLGSGHGSGLLRFGGGLLRGELGGLVGLSLLPLVYKSKETGVSW